MLAAHARKSEIEASEPIVVDRWRADDRHWIVEHTEPIREAMTIAWSVVLLT